MLEKLRKLNEEEDISLVMRELTLLFQDKKFDDALNNQSNPETQEVCSLLSNLSTKIGNHKQDLSSLKENVGEKIEKSRQLSEACVAYSKRKPKE